MTKTEALAALHQISNGDLCDATYEGGTWMAKATETADTLADFEAASRQWNEADEMTTGTIAGLPCVRWASAQARRGDVRRALSVIDLGDVRVAVNYDVEEWMAR